MGQQVCMNAVLQCSFGTAPSSLMVLPTNRVLTGNVPDANIMDHIPMVNILPFAMCNSVLNPATKRPPPVFFTPAPCVPATSAPWVPGSPTVLLGGQPTLNNSSKLMCNWGGVISINFAGQATVDVP